MKCWKITAGYDHGGPESGPMVSCETWFVYADTVEDAIEEFELNCTKDGYCGCSAKEAVDHEIKEWQSYCQIDNPPLSFEEYAALPY